MIDPFVLIIIIIQHRPLVRIHTHRSIVTRRHPSTASLVLSWLRSCVRALLQKRRTQINQACAPFPNRPSFMPFRPDRLVTEISIHETCSANQNRRRTVSCSACVSSQPLCRRFIASFHVPTAPHRETRRMYENVGDGRGLPVRVAPIDMLQNSTWFQ